jgi:hypothetical protein
MFTYECEYCGANEDSKAVDCCDFCIEDIFVGNSNV